jgi:hypothetical protein
VIVTDPVDWKDPSPKNIWGVGARLYYCGEEERRPLFKYAISDAIQFSSTEAAEIRLLVLCVIEPDLIDHGHIMEKDEAWVQWKADLVEYEKKLESQR